PWLRPPPPRAPGGVGVAGRVVRGSPPDGRRTRSQGCVRLAPHHEGGGRARRANGEERNLERPTSSNRPCPARPSAARRPLGVADGPVAPFHTGHVWIGKP